MSDTPTPDGWPDDWPRIPASWAPRAYPDGAVGVVAVVDIVTDGESRGSYALTAVRPPTNPDAPVEWAWDDGNRVRVATTMPVTDDNVDNDYDWMWVDGRAVLRARAPRTPAEHADVVAETEA